MSDLIDEAATAAGPASAAEAADLSSGQAAGEAVDASAAEAAPVEEAPAAAQTPAFDREEFEGQLEYLRQQNAQLVEYLQSQQQPQAEQGQPQFDPAQLVDEFGNLNPVALAQFMAQNNEQLMGAFDQRFQQIQAPLAAREEAETIAEGEQRLQDILADDVSRNGEFSPKADVDKQARGLVRMIADQQFVEVAQQYGMSPRAAEIAMGRAAAQVRDMLRANAEAAVEAHVNHNATLAGARSEPGAAAGNGVVTSHDDLLQLSNRELALRHSQRNVA